MRKNTPPVYVQHNEVKEPTLKRVVRSWAGVSAIYTVPHGVKWDGRLLHNHHRAIQKHPPLHFSNGTPAATPFLGWVPLLGVESKIGPPHMQYGHDETVPRGDTFRFFIMT